ncbi:serine protease, partial [Luteimonas panaciterrae]|uniref:serine protease n=1 Tax=Luteimonas panaciterrae TaxID=363885 RepID=UPI001CF99520
MIQGNALRLTLAVAVSGAMSAAAATPDQSGAVTKMGPAPVTAAPKADALGGSEFRTGSHAKSSRSATHVVDLVAPDQAVIKSFHAHRLQQSKTGMAKMLQIGFGRKVNRRIDLTGLPWEPLVDGTQGARFVIASAGAAALRAQLSLKPVKKSVSNPATISLRFAGDDGRIFGDSGDTFAGNQAIWTPIVSGDAMTVEIVLPKGQRPSDYVLTVPKLSHLMFNPVTDSREIGKSFDDIGESGSCEQDIVCRKNPTPGFLAAASAVAHIAISGDEGDTRWCTGTLLNNNNSPKRSLFWTAAHCVADQAAASSFVTYWFFEATACDNDTASPKTVVLSGGTKLLFRNANRDTALLELKAAPPSGAYYAGWSSEPIDTLGVSAEGIHHPAGDLK